MSEKPVTSRPGKRTLHIVSAAFKLSAVERVRSGESKASVARDVDVPESTLRGWCKAEDKIRFMVMNSSAPDMEDLSHLSPASSSGIEHRISYLSSEEEDLTSLNRKKMRVEVGSSKHTELDCDSLIYGFLANNLDREDSKVLKQQLGMLANEETPLVLDGNRSAGSFVADDLQYSRRSIMDRYCIGNNNNNNKRHSISSTRFSLIAPISRLDSNNYCKSRNSFPLASEKAASMMAPGLPERANAPENHKAHEDIWRWLAQQEHFKQASFDNSSDHTKGSWFWQWYKSCAFAPVDLSSSRMAAEESRSKIKDVLDEVLYNNNNNDKVSQNLNLSGSDGEEVHEAAEANADEACIPAEEALDHGTKFIEWLDQSSEACAMQHEIMQFNNLFENLIICRNSISTIRQRRRKQANPRHLIRNKH